MQTPSDSVVARPSDIQADVSALWSTLDAMLDGLIALLPRLAIAAVVFAVFVVVARIVRQGVQRATANRARANVGLVFGRVVYVALVALGVLVAITIVLPSFTPARLVSLLGVGGIAVGFAFKDIFQNLLAGLLLLLNEPFKVGDEITAGPFTGTVEEVETRATHIRTYDGRRVVVPNSNVYTEPVTVITAYNVLRTEVDIGIGYGDRVDEARRLVHAVLAETEGVLAEPAPDVLLWELAGSSVTLRVRWWSRPLRGEVVHVRSQVLEGVKARLTEAGIDLPFPTTQVLFHDQTEATDGDRTRQREGWPAGASPPAPRTIAAALGQMPGTPNGGSRSPSEPLRAS